MKNNFYTEVIVFNKKFKTIRQRLTLRKFQKFIIDLSYVLLNKHFLLKKLKNNLNTVFKKKRALKMSALVDVLKCPVKCNQNAEKHVTENYYWNKGKRSQKCDILLMGGGGGGTSV
jgi:hypothetical protein